jgi:adenylate cyclase
MHEPPLILIADDHEANRDILEQRLKAQGYDLIQAEDGEQALRAVLQHQPDLILLDVMMPKLDGFEVCRRLRSDPQYPYVPVILVTAKTDTKDIVAGLNAGGDEYLTKPVDQAALVARVRSILRQKALYDQVQAQATELSTWNEKLARRITEQIAEIERVSRLKRFLAPQIAELIVSSGDEHLLESHRRNVTVTFCELRGFTAFAERAAPEEVWEVLGEYHTALGRLIHKFQGTLERFIGDGLMVLFNDPLPCPDPSLQAVRLAVAMRDCVGQLTVKWARAGHQLRFGVGISNGYATIGRVGFEGRSDYTVIGSVTNAAVRLCGEAQNGQILVDAKVQTAVEGQVQLDAVGDLVLKDFQRPIAAYNVVALSSGRLKTP